MIIKDKNIRPLVIGIGIAGRRHLEAQLNLGIKTGIYTNNPQTIESLKKNKNIIVFDNLEEGIDWSNLIHVCTPDDKHTQYVALALKKRKNVLCEKALTTKLKDALYLQKLAQKNKATLIVGQNYRLTPTFLKSKDLVSKGQIGAITKIETNYLHDANEWQKRTPLRKNKDFLYIAGSHAIDLVCWIINEPVVSIQAVSKKTKPPYPNAFQIILKFASELLGHIKLDASSAQIRNGIELVVEGKNGKLASHNKIDQLYIYGKVGKKPKSVNLPNNQTLTTSLAVKIVDDFLSGESNSFSPLPEINEAVATIRILNAIQKAVNSGKNELIYY